MDKEFLEKIVTDEKAGKNLAIHAYDKMMWTVRSGYLTLVFGGWGFIIKSAIDKGAALVMIKPYILLLAAFTISLSIGAYFIDRNYTRRKFRVIHAINEMMELIMSDDKDKIESNRNEKLTTLLKISGDADNKTYRFKAYNNEMKVGNVIYMVTCGLIIIIVVYLLIQL